ncbi:MAG: C45 family autoproteolytic acyltransferase/hydrolase [Polyangiales bacterium]
MYTSDIPEYRIDLSLPERDRWSHVIRAEQRVGRRFTSDVAEVLKALPGFARTALLAAYKLSGGRYVDEMEAIAQRLNLDLRDVLAMQCSYELSQGYEKVFGCTAGVRTFPTLGPVHVRALDWPIPSFGDATRVFRFVDGEREFVTVGVVGYVGVLSGMLPGAYSLSINYAPTSQLPGFDFGPAFLAREVLENCDTYADAVSVLRDTPLAAPCFFTVCGAQADEFCVIERGRKDAAVRGARVSVIAQANHHVSSKMTARNAAFHAVNEEGGSIYAFSKDRAETLERHLRALPANASIDDIADTLDVDPVCNDDTYQQMLFAPKTGEWRAWRWTA